MKQWDIVMWNFSEGRHPAVIVSHPDRIALKPVVNVLLCSCKRAARHAEINEIILDEADGLDWPTFCKCDLLYDADKEELGQPRGSVILARRRLLVQKLIACLNWIGP